MDLPPNFRCVHYPMEDQYMIWELRRGHAPTPVGGFDAMFDTPEQAHQNYLEVLNEPAPEPVLP